MCKFSQSTHIGYRRLCGSLIELIEDIESSPTSHLNESMKSLTVSPIPHAIVPTTGTIQPANTYIGGTSTSVVVNASTLLGSLVSAIQNGNYAAVKAILDQPGLDHTTTSFILSSLSYSNRSMGLKLGWMDYWGIDSTNVNMTTLHYTVELSLVGNLSILEAILEKASVSSVNSTGSINLIEVMNNCRRMGRQPVMAPDDGGKPMQSVTVLTWAAILGNLDAVRLLLEKGADVNSRENWLRVTPLMAQCFLAARTDRSVAVTNALISAGASLDVQDNLGNTALHLALFMDNLAVCMALLDGGASVDLPNYDNLTAYDASVRYGTGLGLRAAIEKRRGTLGSASGSKATGTRW
jgi:ankyrin repeat protein